MTITVAHRVQTCFTKYMETITSTKSKRESIYQKAERILSDPSRVETISSHRDYWLGMVRGDHGTYRVCAVSASYAELLGHPGERLTCRCRAGRQGKLCSHAIVAEEMLRRGEDG